MYSDKSPKGKAVTRTPKTPGAIFVVGAAQSGKATFANYLAAEMRQLVNGGPLPAGSPAGYALDGWNVCETGDLIAQRMIQFLTDLPADIFIAGWGNKLKENKSEWRLALTNFADSHRDAQCDYWMDKALHTNARIIVGVRRECEARARVERGFDDVWIFVERYGREEKGTFEGVAIKSAVPEHFRVISIDLPGLRKQAEINARLIAQYWNLIDS